jgi:hypothetical protein
MLSRAQKLLSVDEMSPAAGTTLPFAPRDFGTSHRQLFNQIKPLADRLSTVARHREHQ